MSHLLTATLCTRLPVCVPMSIIPVHSRTLFISDPSYHHTHDNLSPSRLINETAFDNSIRCLDVCLVIRCYQILPNRVETPKQTDGFHSMQIQQKIAKLCDDVLKHIPGGKNPSDVLKFTQLPQGSIKLNNMEFCFSLFLSLAELIVRFLHIWSFLCVFAVPDFVH